MLKKALFTLVLCAGIFLISSNSSHAGVKTVIGHPYWQGEGMIDHATLVVGPNDLTGVLFIGDLEGASESFKQCFQKGMDKGGDVSITGNVVPYDSPYYKEQLIIDEHTTCIAP